MHALIMDTLNIELSKTRKSNVIKTSYNTPTHEIGQMILQHVG